MPAVSEGAVGSRIIPEPREWARTSVTLPQEIWDRVNTNLRAVNATRPGPERYSRDEFMAECLAWAMREIEKESSEGKLRGGR